MKWRVAIVFSVLTLGSLSATTQAQSDAINADCGCLWEGSFSKVAPQADLVLLGQVQAIKGNAVDLVPETILKGTFWQDTLRVWMKTQGYCRPPAEYFALGSRWVMALSQIQERPEDSFNPSTPNQSFGRLLDYQLSSCGGYWLRVNGNTVTGNLVANMPRFYHQPDMSPVLVDLVAGYLAGTVPESALIEASRVHPEAVDTLILDTRSFLRGQEGWIENEDKSGDEGEGEED